MKLIKGYYQTELRKHEDFKNYNYNFGDYFLQDNGNFTYSLYVIGLNEDAEPNNIEVCTVSQNYKQYYTISQLKEKCTKKLLEITGESTAKKAIEKLNNDFERGLI